MEIHKTQYGVFISKCGRVFKELNYTVRGTKKRKYLVVRVNRLKRIDIHRLMALTFLEKTPGKKWVLHNNDNSMDNRLENLRWGSPLDNAKDAKMNGRFLGARWAKEVRNAEIIMKVKSGERPSAVAKQYKLSEGRVSQILRGC